MGLIRYGTPNAFDPEGWQVDMEGAAFPRMTLDDNRNMVATDYRFGVLLTMRQGPWEWKIACYHLSSHFGDQYLYEHPDVDRIHYSRTGFVAGGDFSANPRLAVLCRSRLGLCPWGWRAEPWEFQFGAEYSLARPTGWEGAPFLAVNGRLREENNYGGNLTVETGWQWRGQTGHLFRTGVYYFNGMSDETEFFNKSEQLIGGGVWFDY